MARTPLVTQVDVHLAYGRRVSKRVLLEGFVRVFDLFDRQAELAVDQIYTQDLAVPIIDGDLEDLEHIKIHDAPGVELNSTPDRNPNFRRPTARQAPRSVQFGARLTF